MVGDNWGREVNKRWPAPLPPNASEMGERETKDRRVDENNRLKGRPINKTKANIHTSMNKENEMHKRGEVERRRG